MQRFLTALILGLLALTACDKDNPTEPGQPQGNDMVTENIKETPAYFSIERKENVATFDLKCVNLKFTFWIIII